MSADSNSELAAAFDLAHLDRQTMGDVALRREVLSLLYHRLAENARQLRTAGAKERADVAHAIRGSARGTGANRLASAAQAVEMAPTEDMPLRVLLDRIDEVRAVLANALRPG